MGGAVEAEAWPRAERAVEEARREAEAGMEERRRRQKNRGGGARGDRRRRGGGVAHANWPTVCLP